MRGCYEAKHNENVMEEDKKKARSISCVLLCLLSEESAARTIHCDLISVFLSSYITTLSNYCFLLSSPSSLSLSDCLSVSLSVASLFLTLALI